MTLVGLKKLKRIPGSLLYFRLQGTEELAESGRCAVHQRSSVVASAPPSLASRMRKSSFPDSESVPIWRSHSCQSRSRNHWRNSTYSSSLRPSTARSISSTLLTESPIRYLQNTAFRWTSSMLAFVSRTSMMINNATRLERTAASLPKRLDCESGRHDGWTPLSDNRLAQEVAALCC